MTKIILGADHGGFEIKENIKEFLRKKKIDFEDAGTLGGDDNDDYPDYAFKVAEKVKRLKDSKGILVCGTGTGMVIAANKVAGIRAAMAYDSYSAEMARKDNNTNILCLRGRKFSARKAKKLVNIWLKTEFSNAERHKRRLKKIEHYEYKRK